MLPVHMSFFCLISSTQAWTEFLNSLYRMLAETSGPMGCMSCAAMWL